MYVLHFCWSLILQTLKVYSLSKRRFIAYMPYTKCKKQNKIIFHLSSKKACSIYLIKKIAKIWICNLVQVNLCQKLLFLPKLTHNRVTDCSLNYKFSTWKLQAQITLCTEIVLNVKPKTKSNLCTQQVLSLQFSCAELVIQWTICRHIVV